MGPLLILVCPCFRKKIDAKWERQKISLKGKLITCVYESYVMKEVCVFSLVTKNVKKMSEKHVFQMIAILENNYIYSEKKNI